MAFSQDFSSVAAGERAQRAWRLPVGAVSPLWAVFGAAAGAGVAYWWMTHWTRAVNFEALAGARRIPGPKPARPVEIVAEPEPAAEAESSTAPAGAAEEAPQLVALVEEAPAPVASDDLTRMVGVGPKLSEALAARGVTRFAQIAAWTEADLADIDAALSLKGRAVREAWVAQAKRLAGA